MLTLHDWKKTKVAKTGATTITVYQVQRQVLPSGTHINLTREQNSQALRGSGACSITGSPEPAASGSESPANEEEEEGAVCGALSRIVSAVPGKISFGASEALADVAGISLPNKS